MTLKTAQCIGLACWLAAASTAAPAAELELEGSKLVVYGVLDGTALPRFVQQVDSGRVRTVLFEDSLGGDAEVAQAYARVIRDKGLRTEARGQCQAACAFAFLAGKEHRFARSPGVNTLLIPLVKRPGPGELNAGRWRGDGAQPSPAQAAAPATPAAAAQVVNLSTGTAAGAQGTATPVAGAALASHAPWQPGQGVLFTSTPTLFGRVYNTYWCDGTQGADFSRCERLSDADPYKLGVLTQ